MAKSANSKLKLRVELAVGAATVVASRRSGFRPKGKLIKLKILAATCMERELNEHKKKKTTKALSVAVTTHQHAPQLKCYRYYHFDGLRWESEFFFFFFFVVVWVERHAEACLCFECALGEGITKY